MSSQPPQTGSAAVAIIKCYAPHESILILRRVAHPKDPWSGHFSFPGGRKERQDSNLLTTCLRETREETGLLLLPDQLEKRFPLEPAGLKLKEPLWVSPFLFTIPAYPSLTLNPNEIQSSCWLNVQQFKDKDRHESVEMYPGHFFPAYPLEDYYLWGFTYKLLRNILQLDR